MALGDIFAGLAQAHHEREMNDAAFARHDRERKGSIFADLANNPNYAPEQQEWFLKAAIAHYTDPKEAKKYDIKDGMVQVPVELMKAQKPLQSAVDAELKPGDEVKFPSMKLGKPTPLPVETTPSVGGNAPLQPPAPLEVKGADPFTRTMAGSADSALLQPPTPPPALSTPVGQPMDPARRQREALAKEVEKAQSLEDIKETSRVANDKRDAAKAKEIEDKRITARKEIAAMNNEARAGLVQSKGLVPLQLQGERVRNGRIFREFQAFDPDTNSYVRWEEDAGEAVDKSKASNRDKDVEDWAASKESDGYEKTRTGYDIWKNAQAVKTAKDRKVATDSVGQSAVTPEALDILATVFAKTGQLPALGMGNAATNDRRKIFDRAAQLFPATDLASNKADFAANQQSLNQLQKNRDAVGSFEKTGLKNLDLFLKQAEKVVDSGSPWVNKPLRAVDSKGLGSGELAAFNAARQVAINEIARVVSNPNLTGVLSDSARKEVESFIPQEATLAQVVAVANVLKMDMANRIESLDDQLGEIRKRLSSVPKSNAAPATPPKNRPPLSSFER